MGYYTHHSIEIERLTNIDLTSEEHIVQIEKRSGYDYLFDEQVKWYDHKEEMKEYSSKYPKVLFILSGEGEEAGDLWREYYLNGKVQACEAKITYPAFDESKLV